MLEMIPTEFWRTLHAELMAVDWVTLRQKEREEQEARKRRIESQYNNAIYRRKRKQIREATRKRKG